VHTQWLIKSGFAATKDRFVISGSEGMSIFLWREIGWCPDGNVYVWQTSTAQSIAVLQGHDSSVNAVAWNPVLSRRIFASCSDDSTMWVAVIVRKCGLKLIVSRIWQPRGGMDEDEIKAEQEYITFDEDGTVGEDPGMVL
jgi:WD40 repeat protein